jgi:tetratricopeptide (TPR) repeat protein
MRRGNIKVGLAATLALLLLPFIEGGIAHADDTDTCFSKGTDDYKRADFFSQGLDACTRVIESGTVAGTRLAYYYRGRAYWKHQLNDLDGALEDFNQAINLDPKHVEGYDYRADVWKAKGEIDRALADYEIAIRLDPTYAAAYYSRGRIYESQGEVARARADYNAALAVPEKDRIAKWAQDQARQRLRELPD